MRKLAALNLLVGAVLFTTVASAGIRGETQLDSIKNYDFSENQTSQVRLRIEYPGVISGNCAVKLQNSSDSGVTIEAVLKELDFSYEYGGGRNVVQVLLSNDHEALMAFHDSRYTDAINVKVRSGQSFRDLLSHLKTTLSGSVVRCIQ